MLNRAIYRFRQFLFAMFSRYSRADEAFTRSYLNIEEMALFNQLPGFEKKHAVTVARKMLAAVFGRPEFDETKIAKLGLLHDIGKVLERNTILSKSMLVSIRFFFPAFYDRLARSGEKDLRFRRFYLHRHHGDAGARLLEKIGEPEEILSIIRQHDPRVGEPGRAEPELILLRDADSTL